MTDEERDKRSSDSQEPDSDKKAYPPLKLDESTESDDGNYTAAYTRDDEDVPA